MHSWWSVYACMCLCTVLFHFSVSYYENTLSGYANVFHQTTLDLSCHLCIFWNLLNIVFMTKCCAFSVRKDNIWSLSSSPSSTPVNLPNLNPAALNSPSLAPPQKMIKRLGIQVFIVLVIHHSVSARVQGSYPLDRVSASLGSIF